MKKNLLIIAAIASATLVSCSSEEFGGEEIVSIPTEEVPISFGSYFKAMTRADITGADAAELLGKGFVVSGYKGDQTGTVGSIVFDNYKVEWEANTANTTESNSSNWEYVSKGLIKHAEDHGITSQKIKYWDYSANQYDFIAWSTGKKVAIYEQPANGIPAGSVLVSAINPETGVGANATQAYTFTGKAEDLRECYIADLVTVKKGNSTYKDPVTLKFRQLGTKVRIGIYETVPGYSVKGMKFYTKGGELDATTAGDANTPGVVAPGQIVDNATIFSAGADIYTEGTYTVTFPTVDSNDADNNQAHVRFSALQGVEQTTTVDWGTLNYTIAEEGEKTPGKVFLGRSSSTATFAGNADDNYYVVYLPNESGVNLNLRVDFTLESIDGSGETIEVKNAKAQIPSIYTQWKPGFAYTYLFKISDKTNGRTGLYDPTQPDNATINSDPAGLYPITLDAVVVNAEEDMTQETITTVMTPSITTYQQNSTVVNKNEYTAGNNKIFVTVNEGDAIVDLAGKAALYTITEGTTEAEVVDALSMRDDAANGIVGRSGLELKAAQFDYTNTVEFGADGNAIEIAATGNETKAISFTPAAGTYAFVYTKTAPTQNGTEEKYQAQNWGDFGQGQTKYRYDYTASNGDAQKGVKYFSKDNNDVYTMVAPFIGQGVSNLYLDDQGNTIASGYAVTGTTYYYTLNNGQSYQAAHNVAYEGFANEVLYVFDEQNQVYTAATNDQTPRDGVAYYKKTTENGVDVYTYCVILPQQTDNWFELNTNKYVEATETNEVVGQTYFDKYTKNDGEYYTKVIKVQ